MSGTDASERPLVVLPQGPVRGVWRTRDGHRSAAFLGIPFADAPTGERRFAAPSAPPSWDGERDASAHGPTPQRWNAGDATLIPEPSVAGDETLNVDVFTPSPSAPAASGAGLPVMVWIHGGAFVSGSPASPWYDGAAFCRDGIVTVTLSYRLGFDGFGWIEGAPQNRGVLDWLAGLAWVRDNIAAFGGDPARVTIAGQSAGGGAVLTLLAMPAAAGLFHGAIALSPATGHSTPERARRISTRLAALVGVGDGSGAPARVDELRAVPEKRIEKQQMPATGDPGRRRIEGLRAQLDEPIPYAPVQGADPVPAGIVEALRAGASAGVPLALGTTDDEFTMVTLPYRRPLAALPTGLLLRLAGVRGRARRAYRRDNRGLRGAWALGRYVSDRVFRAFARAVADARVEGARRSGLTAHPPTWMWRFSYRATTPARPIALHCLDVPFFFDRLDAERVEALTGPRPPQRLADEVHAWAVRFITTGDAGWTPWSDRPGSTRVFDDPPAEPPVDPDGYRSVAAL